MSKSKNKDVRLEIGGEESVNKMNTERVRVPIGRNTKFDTSYWEGLPEYQGMRFRWTPKAEVHQHQDADFRLVPSRSSAVKSKSTFSDGSENEWACVRTNSMNGDPMEVYLMVTTAENYNFHIDGPNNARNAEIQHAMGIGRVDAEAQKAGGGLESYAGKQMDIKNENISTSVTKGQEPEFNPVR